jgi:tetratricopeptide (TPR) repeat protein
MPILRRVVAKQCRNPRCKVFERRVGVHEGFCEDCGHPLDPVLGWDPLRTGLAIGAPLGLMLAAYALASFLASRPHPLSGVSRRAIEAWAREVDRERAVTPRRQAELDELVSRERLDPRAVARLVAETRRRVEEARGGVERGLRYAAVGRYSEALQEYQRAVETDPENATAWADLGLANAASGREKEALDGYCRALKIDPGNWLAHYNLGLLWARRGDSEQALRHLEQAFAAQPDPASPEHRSMASDLQAAALPAPIRSDSRFVALLRGVPETGAR